MSGMFDATSPSEPILAPGEPGGPREPQLAEARFAFLRRDGATRLGPLFQRAPLRVLFPRPAPGELPLAALCNVGGGLVAGDRVHVTATVGKGAAAIVTSQAAEKVYRSPGAAVTWIENDLMIGEGAWLEWCPQETILFDRARLRRRLTLDIAPTGRVMLGEMVVLGRLASGEVAREGFLLDRIEVRRGGCLVWLDSLRLDGVFDALLDSKAGLKDVRTFATFVYAAPDAAERLEPAREQVGDLGAATLVNGLLVARWLGTDPLALRRAFALFWARFRAAAAGLPPAMPRLWHV